MALVSGKAGHLLTGDDGDAELSPLLVGTGVRQRAPR